MSPPHSRGGGALRVQQPQVHDAVEGQREDLGSFVCEAEHVGGPARGVRAENLCLGAGGGGCVRSLHGPGGAPKDCAVAERSDAAVVQRSPRVGPRVGSGEPAAGRAVRLGVEGGEVAVGAGVVLCEEPGFVHAEGDGQKGRPVWDGEGGCGRRASGEVAELRGGGV